MTSVTWKVQGIGVAGRLCEQPCLRELGPTSQKSHIIPEQIHPLSRTIRCLEWRQVVLSEVYKHNCAPEDMVRSSSTESFPDIKSPNQVMEKLPGASCYLSPSRIPLPKCLEESPVRINRPRSEVRNRDLPEVENQKAVIRKAAVVLSFQENEQSSEWRNSQLHGFLKPTKMQEDGAIAALTPISVNVLSASGGQDGRASSEKIMDPLPAPAVKHLPKNIFRQSDKQSSNSEELLDAVKLAENFVHSLPAVALKNLAKSTPSPSDEQSSSSGECLDDVKLAKSVEDGGSCELQNVGQTVVWSNAVFCTDFCNEDSSSMESIYSTHCSPSESQCAAANRTLDVTGNLRSLSLRSSSKLSGRSSRLPLEKSFGEVSSKGLVGNLLDSSVVTLTVNSELGSGDKAEAEHCMGTSDVSCTMIGGSVKDSVTDRDRLNEAQCRNTAMNLELAATSMSSPTFTMQTIDLNCMQEADVRENQVDWTSTKKILFNASPLGVEDRGLASEASLLQSSTTVANAGKTSTSIAENHEQLVDFKSSTQWKDIRESVELQEACTMTNTREPSMKESMLQSALPPDSLVHLTEAIVEADLEDEIQLEIEDEVSREIIALSQKLANLQSRRRRNSKLPAVSKSPEMSLLTPPVPLVTKENYHQNKSAAASTCSGGRQRGKRAVAAKFLQSMTPREEATRRLESCSSPRIKGKACFGTKGKQMSSPHPGKWRMSLGLRLSFASNGSHSHKFARFSNDEHENSPQESSAMREEGTIQSLQSPGNKLTRLGLSCPRAQPRTIRRFDWVKTLRSGESDLRSSPEARVSSRMYHQNTPTGRLLGRESRPKNLEGATGRWRHDLNRTMVEELGNRLNCDHGATPADAHMGPDLQGTRGGRVVPSRYASSSPPADVNTKSPTPDGDDYLGWTAHQILKAGSRRSLAGDKSLRSKPGRRVKSCCPNSQGGIRPRGNSMGPLCGGVPAMKANSLPESQAQESREVANVARKMWFGAPETYQTEYETFLDGPDNDRNFAELFKASMRLHEEIPASSFVLSGAEQIFPTFSPRETFELSLPSDAKMNFIRCMELSVSTKKKAARRSTKESSRSPSSFERTPICTSMEKVIFSFRGSSCQRWGDGDENRHVTELVTTSPLSVKRLFVEGSPKSSQTERQSVRKSIKFLRKVCRAARDAMSLHDETPPVVKLVDIENGAYEPSLEEEQNKPTTVTVDLLRSIIFSEETISSTYYDFFGSTPSSLREFPDEEELVHEPDTDLTLAVSSFSHERSREAEDESVGGTEELVISSVTRARWKELFDALEKERRRLPRIRTNTGPKKKLASPRDSGCVKRVSDRVKVMEYFSLDRLTTNTLQGRGDDHLRTSDSPTSIGDTQSQTGQKNRLVRSPAS